MKRFHPLLLMAFCLLAACDVSPPPSTTGGAKPEAVSLRISELTSNNTLFPDQAVCGSSTEQKITVYNEDASSRKIGFAEATEPFVLTAIQDEAGTKKDLSFTPFLLAPGEKVHFLVKFSPRTPAHHSGYLKVFSDAPSPLEIPLSGKGTGPRLELSPPALTLSLTGEMTDAGTPGDAGTLESPFQRTVRLKNDGNEPLNSLALRPVTSAFSAELSKTALGPGDTANLVVTFAPPSSSSEPFFTDTLLIDSDDPCSPSTKVPLSGFRTPVPKLVSSSTALAFAEQEVGSSSEPQQVKLTNEGGAPLTIDSLSIQGAPDSGTPFVVSPSGGFSLEPGQERLLSVRFTPTTTGPHQATLQLVSNSKSSPDSIVLTGDGVRTSPLTVEPLSVDFPKQAPGQVETKKVSVKNTGSKALSVTATVPSAFTVTPTGPFPLSPGDIQELVLTSSPSSGTASGPLLGQLTLSSGASTRIIPLHGEVVRTRITLSATSISFDEQEVGTTPQEKTLVLTNPTALPVKVYEVAASSLVPYSVTGLPVDIPPDESRTVTVSFNPGSKQQWNRTLQLTSNAIETITAVTLSGTAVAPELSITEPASPNLSFGIQEPGTETTQEVTLKNIGDAPLTLEKIAPASDSAPFKVQGLNPPRTMNPGDSIKFGVTFNPSSPGYKEATLQFYASNSSTPLTSPQLKLSGTSSVSFNPSDKVDFKAQRIAETASMKIRITNDTGASETLQLVSVGTKNGTPEFSLVGTYANQLVAPGDDREVEVQFKPTTVDRNYSGSLVIVYQGYTTKIARTKLIPLQGLGATALLKVSPDLPFDAVEVGKPGKMDLTLTNEGKSTLRINSINITNLKGSTGTIFMLGRTGWPMYIPAGGEEKLPITFTPDSLAAVTADLEITSNATSSNVDSSGKTKVLLSGWGAAAKAIFETRTLGFGEVPIGQTGTLSLRITNTGSSPLRVNKPTPSAHFLVKDPPGGWPMIIPIQATNVSNFFDFQIAFIPDSGSPVEESLTFTSNDPYEPAGGVVVSLKGTGTRPKLTVRSSVHFGAAVPGDGGTAYQEMKALLTLQNDGKAPLVINNLNVTRPFRVVIPSTKSYVQSTQAGSFPPIGWQQQQDIELRVMPTSGRMMGTLTITTNEGAGDASIKEVALLVGEDGVAIQGAPLDFGTCAMDESPTTKVEKGINLWNTAKVDDSVTQIALTGPDGLDFSAVSKLPLTVPVTGGTELKLSFKPRKGAAGQRKATAQIYTKNRHTPLVLELDGVATGPFSGFKNFKWEVDFGTQRLSDKKEPVRFPLQNDIDRPIFVKSYGLEGARKDDFAVEPDALSCREPGPRGIELRTGELCYLKLSYVAKETTRSSAALVLEVSTENEETRVPAARVTLKGEMVPSILSAESSEVDFGLVTLRRPIEPNEPIEPQEPIEQKVLTITNQSSVVARMLLPEVSDPESFSVEAVEQVTEIPPAGTTTLLVTFHPRKVGEVKGELRLRLQDEQVTDLSIELHGKVQLLEGEGGGCSSAARGGGPLLAGWLLLVALGARRRSRSTSP
ncbi:choice-of-anchor D domain-containing protein [Archangium violaceum]|uniref:choice-of-anchor D domain-containing protein n=1 Tax=Archangium violaceum TaxID=83451 RepID=UPI00194EA25C|nr:choice-of-anchor D domain-containing protein [Archangium violaceum]QRO01014.1 choice-of-anchor D domain-containing protein [Archangium violaceum]